MTALTEVMACKVNLEADCGDACREFAKPLYEQLSNGRYDTCSTLEIPSSVEEWRQQHRTGRKRADRAVRLGYRFDDVLRHERADDIYEINTSKPERQGRQMSEGYRKPPSTTPDPEYPCSRHGVHPYGVMGDDGRMRAYLWLYRAGELALVSQILGHGEHEPNDVMFLLFQGVVEREIGNGPGWLIYNRHDSGMAGLREFKTRLGFEPRYVRWKLA